MGILTKNPKFKGADVKFQILEEVDANNSWKKHMIRALRITMPH